MLGAAFGTVPERLGHPAFRRDRPALPPQFGAVNGLSTRRYREHEDRPDPPPCCRPRNPPCVTTLDAGPYVLPGLPWQTHTRSLEAPVIEVNHEITKWPCSTLVANASKDGCVFTTGWGEPIYPDTVTSLMAKLIHAHNQPDQGPPPKSQLPQARLHDLRHIHCTTLLLSGVPVHVVAARLGR